MTGTVRKYLLVATRVKKRTSCQMSFMMVASSFWRVIPPRKRGFEDTIMSEEKEKKRRNEDYNEGLSRVLVVYKRD
jgi:hypothetical protein